MLTDEMFVTLVQETVISSVGSIVAVTIVVFLITGSIFISIITLLTII